MLSDASTSALTGAVVWQIAQEEVQGAGGAGDGILRTEFPTRQTLKPDTTDDHLD